MPETGRSVGSSPANFAAGLSTVPLPQQRQQQSSLPSLGDSASEDLSPLMERKLGEQVMHDIRRNPDYLDDAPTLEYLEGIGTMLVAARPDARGEAAADPFFFAVRDTMLNAFAMPGGFIGVHSALVLAAQSESELASVLAHEIGHVAQRHYARMLGQQRQDFLIPLAAMVLAGLAAAKSSSPDAPTALVVGGQALAIQRQLNFSQDAEREADRVGLTILNSAGFDTSGMVAFFGRMQTASRNYSDTVPAYLRSHPLTTERIADIQARIRSERYRQWADSLDFHLVRSRLRVLQDESVQGWRDAAVFFENQLLLNVRQQSAAAYYGLAYLASRQGNAPKAWSFLKKAKAAALGGATSRTQAERKPGAGGADAGGAMFASLALEIHLLPAKDAAGAKLAVREAEAAHAQFPLSRGIARQYAEALLAAGRQADAVRFLRDQVQLYRGEAKLHALLAKAHSQQGKLALQHMALAEQYALTGSLPAALDQLTLARNAPDGAEHDHAVIDARERELQALVREEAKEAEKKR